MPVDQFPENYAQYEDRVALWVNEDTSETAWEICGSMQENGVQRMQWQTKAETVNSSM